MTGFFWLASYPKSGNTWLRLALWSVQNGGAPVDFADRLEFAPLASSRRRFDKLLGIESSDLTPAEILRLRPRSYELQVAEAQAAGPIFCKVHDAWHLTPSGEPLFPPGVTLGSVYILRDPRDIAVSFAAHQGRAIEQVIDQMNDPTATLSRQTERLPEQLPERLGSWSFHVSSWIAAGGIQPPLILHYEAMLQEPARELRRVLAYIGWTPSDAVVDAAIRATRFCELQAAEDRQGFNERPATATRFFRSGIAGGWRAALSEAQRARIEADHGDLMRRMGYL